MSGLHFLSYRSRLDDTVRRLRFRVSYQEKVQLLAANLPWIGWHRAWQLGVLASQLGSLITSTIPALPLNGDGNWLRHTCRIDTSCASAGLQDSARLDINTVERVEAVLGPE